MHIELGRKRLEIEIKKCDKNSFIVYNQLQTCVTQQGY